MKRKFNIDEVVWAKIKGFPWWPASVSITPDFLTDHQILEISSTNIQYNLMDH